jgi:hypothetical protein
MPLRIACAQPRVRHCLPSLGTADAPLERGLCQWEVDMGRFCAWCGSVMLGFAATRTPSSYTICSG